ncbi:MAG TPA: outer membrane beta-barrel protein, partial [Puia sp.]
NYKLNKRWMFQSGISYSWSRSIMDSSKSYAVMNTSGDIAFKLNMASGFSFLNTPSFIVPVVGDSLSTAKTHSELHYITVPLVLSYRIPLRRFTLLAGAGMTLNVLTHATLETDIYGANYKQNESEIPIRGLKKVNFGLLVKTEIQYRVTSKMAVSLISSFKNTLGPVNMNNSGLQAYPYNFGIGAGIVYSF